MPNSIHTRKAALRLNSYNPETRRFIAVAATETPVRMAGLDECLVCREGAVDLGRMPVPLLRDHRRTLDDQLGTVVKVWFEAGEMLAEVQLTERAAATYGRDLEAGHTFGVSVGYSIAQHSESGPRVRRVTRWALHEVSLTPVGADPRTKTRSSPQTQTGVSDMENDTVTPEAPANPAPEQSRAMPADRVRSAVAAAGLDASFGAALIRAGSDESTVNRAILDEMQERSERAPRARVGHSHDNPDEIMQRQIGALTARAQGTAPADSEREFRGLTLPEHLDLVAQRAGVRTFGMSREQRAQLALRAMGTSDMPNHLLGGTANRVALAKYGVARSPFVDMAKKSTVSDFRDNERLRAGEFGALEELGEHGEIKHTSREESKQTIRVKPFARRIDYSMKAILNDDLGALTDAAEQFGIAAAARDADELIAVINANPAMDDGFNLFSADHNNTIPWGSLAGTEAIGLMSDIRQAMRGITGLDGSTLLNIAPKHLVVSKEMETIAEMFLAQYQAQAFSETNPFQSKLTLMVEPRLEPYQWYVFADPALAPVLELAHLAGREGPQIETQQAWDTWGVSFRCIHVVGAAAIGWRGAYRVENGDENDSNSSGN